MESAADWPPPAENVSRKPKVAQFCAAPWPNFTPALTPTHVAPRNYTTSVDATRLFGMMFALRQLERDLADLTNVAQVLSASVSGSGVDPGR